MTITPRPNILLALVIEWEPGHRIDTDTWTPAGGGYSNCWYIVHVEGKPSKVEENGIEYTEKGSLQLCQDNVSTWYWDSSNNRLYVHTSGHNTPYGNYILLSYFWERFGTHSPMILDGKYYLPYLSLDTIQSIVTGTSGYHEGGTKQTFGVVKIGNADGYFDARLSDYIYEAKRMRALTAEYTIVDGVFTPKAYNLWDCVWEGWSGNITWSDETVEVETEDLRGIRL